MPEAQPLVSIITVVYNAGKLLEPTMLSVFEQTYPHIEYIVIDGGSTDGTQEVIARYADKISFRVSEKDRGIYDAMNKGLAHATGDYVWFMNAGDFIYSPDTLAQVMATNNNLPTADLYYGDAELIDSEGRSLGLRAHKALPKHFAMRDMQLGMVVLHQAMIVRRSITSKYSLRYPIAADINWVIDALKCAGPSVRVQNTGLTLCKFLVGGTSTQQRKKSWVERFTILRNQFGLPIALWSHVRILWQAVFRRSKLL